MGEFAVGSLEDVKCYLAVDVHPSWQFSCLNFAVGEVVFFVKVIAASHMKSAC